MADDVVDTGLTPAGGVHVTALAPGFAPVVDLVRSFARADPGWAAQLVVHADGAGGRVAVDLHVGEGYDPSAIHLQASASKGVTGVVVAAVLAEHGVDVHAPVTSVWPELTAGGAAVTIAQLLSHQVGLLATSGGFDAAAWGRGREVAADLAAQEPVWRPGSAIGYHALSIGPLADELVFRLTGRGVAEEFERRVRALHELDFWLRLPPEQEHRVVDVVLPPLDPASGPASLTGDLTALATGQLDGFGPQDRWIASRELMAAGVPSVSGTGSARGLAGVYAAAIGVGGRPPLLAPDVVARHAQVQAAGEDLVLGGHRRYAVLFQKPAPAHDFGTAAAFGHDGAGGALGFADPGTGVAFGFTTRVVPRPGGADRRALALAQLVRRLRRSGAA